MNPLPSLILNEVMNDFPIPEGGYITETKQNSTAPDAERVVGAKQKRKHVKKNRPFAEKDNIEVNKGVFGQNQVIEGEMAVKQKRKYGKRSKVPIAANAIQAPNEEEFSQSRPDHEIGGAAPGIEEEEAGKRDLDDQKRKRGRKFEHVFINGLNTIAIDGLEFHRLARKLIRAKAGKERPKGWAEVCSNYKIIINAELSAIKAELELMTTIATRGCGHMPMERRISIGEGNVVGLALEALEEVPKTWKNAHAIFVSAKKSLQNMDYFVGYMELCRQDPDYWWSKTGGFALEDIPSGRHCPLGGIVQEDETGDLKIDGVKKEDEGYFTERIAMETSYRGNSDENDPEVEDGEHLKAEEEFKNKFEEYLGQEYRALVGGKLDFSKRKADWWV